MFSIILKEKNKGFLNLELIENKKTITFSDTNLKKDFLYQFGESFLNKCLENTTEKLSEKNSINTHDLISTFALFFLSHDEIRKDTANFVTGLLRANQYEIIRSKQNPDKRFFEVFLNLLQFRTQEKIYNGHAKLISLQEEYKDCGEKVSLDGLYFNGLDKVDSRFTPEYLELRTIKLYQNSENIEQMYKKVFDTKEFGEFLQRKSFDTIAVIPNNVVRKISFNQYIGESLKQKYSTINFIDITVNEFEGKTTQKNLRGLCNRIENAKKLFSISSTQIGKKVLLIDDVFGSGATMNTITNKIKAINPTSHITGFSILGSYRKGFDVVNEV